MTAALHLPDVTPPERLHTLKAGDPSANGPVLCWLQQAQRAADNHALEYAVALAARHQRPVAVVVVLDPAEPGFTERNATFAIEGLRDLRADLRVRSIDLFVRLGPTVEAVAAAARDAAALVVDRGYLRHQRAQRQRLTATVACPLVEIEGEAIVPVAAASPKAEYAARTLRPKLWRALERFRGLPVRVDADLPHADAPPLGGHRDVTDALDDVPALVAALAPDARARSVATWFQGGARAAHATLERFISSALPTYATARNQPQRDAVSHLGMYLRHGHIAPQRVLHEVTRVREGGDLASEPFDAFVEELLVRRELAINHAWYVPDYDRFEALPEWARATLAKHASDPREARYEPEALEAGETHDPYWNAAMLEMRETGYMHNYMRMYWGKRILAWSTDPAAAYELTATLNDRYFLDGRDPNSYAGVAWVYGRHDRPWPERPVFGTVRTMVAAGLERKADPRGYVAKVERRIATRRLELDDPRP